MTKRIALAGVAVLAVTVAIVLVSARPSVITHPEALDCWISWSYAKDVKEQRIPWPREVPKGFTGTWQARHTNGRVAISEPFEDGKPSGPYREWYRDGTPRRQWTYRDGEIVGTTTAWYGNGQIASRHEYREGKLNGLAVSWNNAGAKVQETTYVNGMKHGKETEYHDDGKLKSRCYYRFAMMHGKLTEWDANGRLVSESHWTDGRMTEPEDE